MFDRIVNGHDIGQFEEGRLKDCIRAVGTETDFLSDLGGINRIELNILLRNLTFDGIAQVLFQFRRRPAAVEKEDTAVLYFTDNIIGAHVNRLMAGEEVRLFNVIRRANGVLAETQV